MNISLRKLMLQTDGLTLGLFGLFGLTMDLLSYFTGVGAWGQQFFHNPTAVGVVEAHGLAICVAVLLFTMSTQEVKTPWHTLGLAAHALMGVSNLIFWQVFVDVNLLPMGYITTIYHWLFVAAHLAALLMPVRANMTLATER
jgi:hypothetical protein